MKIGDVLPDIELKDQEGKNIRLKDFVGKHPLVVYFYPKDDTPGCIVEACGFRDQYEEFESVGALVFGISADSVASHKRFASRYKLSFQLLSDTERKAATAFDVPKRFFGLLPGRVTFVFDIEGKLIHSFNSSIQPVKHIKESINALKERA